MVAPNALTCWASVKTVLADGTTVEKRCRNKPMRGQRVCRVHGGKSKQSVKAGDKRQAVEEVKALATKFGSVRDDPMDILLEQVWLANGMSHALRAVVLEREAHQLFDEDEDERNKTRFFVNQMERWSMNAAQLSALALRAGVEERQLRTSEQHVLGFVGAIRAAIDQSGLSDEQRSTLLEAIARQARQLGSGSAA